MDERLLTSNGIFADHDVIDVTEYSGQNGRKETENTMCQTNQSPPSTETGQVKQGPFYTCIHRITCLSYYYLYVPISIEILAGEKIIVCNLKFEYMCIHLIFGYI